MFNGLEYEYDENIELYINRAIKKALQDYKDTVIIKKDCTSDDSSDNSSSDDEDDDETNSNYNIDEEGPIIIKRIILTTYNSGEIEKHDDIIDKFNLVGFSNFLQVKIDYLNIHLIISLKPFFLLYNIDAIIVIYFMNGLMNHLKKLRIHQVGCFIISLLIPTHSCQ